MKRIALLLLTGLVLARASGGEAQNYGPAAALAFAEHYRGAGERPGELYCYPDATGVPLADCANIVPMTAELWTPSELVADYRRRMAALPERERKKGIIVMLKTERCATKAFRGCTVTTAALEKRSSPLAAQFLIYGVRILPRDGDDPPGSRALETGADAWKNEAAGVYRFRQGPGATLVFLDPADGARLAHTDAARLGLTERNFVRDGGSAPLLHALLERVLREIAARSGGGVGAAVQ
ncbi:MAG TPA: hypothetical protein VG710_08030 [Opitutus sp.]|nr:hypothetical protein [Opitutus sp.]